MSTVWFPSGSKFSTFTPSVLLGFAATIGILTKFVRIPYTIALVVAGLAVALFGDELVAGVKITEELVLVLFLPPLLLPLP